ncbi:MAG: beta strand repeat-containing protein [Pseudomonadota bacterium]
MNGPSLIVCRLPMAARALLAVAALLWLPVSPAWGVVWTTSAVKDLSCAGTRAGGKLTCTAGEFTVSPVFSAEPGTPPFCTAGAEFNFKVDLGLSGTNTDRYDIGFFVGQTGNDPTEDDASKQCSVATFPTSTVPASSWEDDDGNACGDYNGGGVETTRINEIKVLCSGDSSGALNVPYVLTYKQSTGGICTGPADVINGAPSKCNAGTSAVSGVVAVSAGAYVDITKQTSPDGDPQSFSFTATGPVGSKVVVVTGATLTPTTVIGGTYSPATIAAATNTTTFTLSDGQTARVFINALSSAQDLTIVESAASGWETTAALNCAAVTGAPTITTDAANRTVTAGLSSTNSAAACTITNSKLQPPAIAKSFSVSPIQNGGNSVLSIVVSNPNTATTLTGVAFTDTYPANLLNRTPSLAAISCTAGSTGTLTGGADGGNTLGLSGGSLLAGGSCTLSVEVTSSVNGTYNNSTGTVTSTTAGATTGNSASASLVVGAALVAPSITKTISPGSLGVGSVARLTLTIRNPNNAALANVTVQDTYPAGLVNAATTNITNSCGGNITTDIFGGVAGGNTFGLTGTNNDLTANQVCTVAIDVTSNSAGTYNNTTNNVLSTSAGGLTGNTASATVSFHRPTITKSISPGSIGSSGTATMTITLANASGVAMTGATFIDTFPTSPGNMTVATPLTTSNSCGGTLNDNSNGALAAGDAGIRLNGGTIPAGGSCVIRVDITASVSGNYINSIAAGALTTTNGGSNAAGTSAALFVPNRPTVTKAFAPTAVATNGDSVLTVTLSNSNAIALTGAAFTDTYPVGLVNGPVPAGSTTCGGTVTAAAGGGSVALAGGTIPANGSCTVTVNVRSSTIGSYVNTIPIGGVSTTNAFTNSVAGSATLAVQLMPPVIAKSFSPASLGVNGISRLTLTITNPNNQALANVRVTDTYPAGLVNAATTNITNSCGGNITTDINGGAANGNTFGLTGNNNDMSADQVCTVGIDVTSATAGAYTNTTGNVTTSSGGGGGMTGNTASAVVTFVRPTITKAFSPGSIGSGDTATMTITLANASEVAFTAATFTDVFPVGMTVATPLASSNSCGGSLLDSGGGVLAATDLGIRLSGGTIPAAGNCVITVDVTAATGTYTNTLAIGALSTSGGSNAVATSAVLAVRNLPTIAKAFSPVAIGQSDTATITFTLSNNNATAATGIAFTDSYPAGLLNSTPITVGGTCASVTHTATAGGSTFNVTDGTIPGGAPGTCTITVLVAAAAAGVYDNTTSGVTSSETGVTPGPASNTATLTVNLALTVVKSSSVISDPLVGVRNPGVAEPKRIPGAVIEYTITVSNSAGTVDAVDVVVSDPMPANTDYVTGSLVAGGTVEDDDNAGADEADPNGGDYNLTTPGAVTLRIGTITAGSSSTGKFRVMLQ